MQFVSIYNSVMRLLIKRRIMLNGRCLSEMEVLQLKSLRKEYMKEKQVGKCWFSHIYIILFTSFVLILFFFFFFFILMMQVLLWQLDLLLSSMYVGFSFILNPCQQEKKNTMSEKEICHLWVNSLKASFSSTEKSWEKHCIIKTF